MISLIILFLIDPVVKGTMFTYDELYGDLGPRTSSSTSENAVKELVNRLLGKKAKYFEIVIDPKTRCSDRNLFKIKTIKFKNIVKITGTTGVEAAWGLNHYLKEYCNCHISWDGDQIKIPKILPYVDIEVVANDWFRFYQSIYTVSYSFVWWDWSRWEREIDWMALNGFNLALAFVGQEVIWRRVYEKLGMTEKEICAHFTGPAFLSWGRIGNINRWRGPLSKSWHNHSTPLQHNILRRMREIGITPVIPAFAGTVPRAFKRLFPLAPMKRLPAWQKFGKSYCCHYSLEPGRDFKKTGALFMEEYNREYGNDHVYSADPYKFTRSVADKEYMLFEKRIGEEIYETITSQDSKAIWVLHSTMFLHWEKKLIKDFLKYVPTGKILVVDIQAEIHPEYDNTHSFFGQPFIWSMLHNFGGTLGMHGSSEFINNNIFKARQYTNSTLVGVGVTPEGIDQNYAIYDLITDMFWRKKPVNLTEWFNRYATRRYGVQNEFAMKAWNILKQSVYNYTGNHSIKGQYTIVRHPTLNMKPDEPWYEETDVYKAWRLLLLCTCDEPEIATSNTFLVDLIDVTRQSLQLKLNEVFKIIINQYRSHKLDHFWRSSKIFLKLFDYLEQILATNPKFLLGTWINSAKRLATNHIEMRRYEKNARNQVTLWGPRGEMRDYANKQWSGLIKDYYKPRWAVFLSSLDYSLDLHSEFNQTKVSETIFIEVERKFHYNRFNYPDTPRGKRASSGGFTNDKKKSR